MRRTELSGSGDAALLALAAATLKRLTHLDGADSAVLTQLARHATLVTIEPGELLIREGDTTAPELYVLIDGALLIRSQSRVINRVTQAGEIIGELAVLQAPPRTADVVAEAAARLLALRPVVLREPAFAGIAAAFYMTLSHSLAQKLRAMTARSHQQLDKVEREAATDRLTGLANRKRLDEFLESMAPIAARSGKPFSLIMADVDHFKRYNDSHGHPSGDVVLAKIGMILQSQIRSGDLAARYGGEEFAVVLPNCDAANAAGIAEKLRSAIAGESFPHSPVTATLGVATSADGTVAGLIERADAALYRGKAGGRNRVVSAVPGARDSR